MKELGEYLRQTRNENGVGLDEASDDLKIDKFELENIEDGNVRAFKDVLSMKNKIKSYAKYLGLDPEKVADEFNDFLFEHTSKISLTDILEAEKNRKKEGQESKVYSPYTKIKTNKINKRELYIIILGILFLALIILIAIATLSPKDEIINKELLNNAMRSDVFELT